MSAPYIAWAFQQRDLTAPQKLVLITLCDRANGERVCFPSIPLIAEDCEISLRAAYGAVRYLCDVRKLISKVTDKQERAEILAKAGARRGTLANVYRILRPADGEPQISHGKTNGKSHTPAPHAGVLVKENSPTPAQPARVSTNTPAPHAGVETPTPAPDAPQPLHHVHKTPAPRAPEPSKESSTEPKTRAGARSELGFNSDSREGKEADAAPLVAALDGYVTPPEERADPGAIAAAAAKAVNALRGIAYRSGRSQAKAAAWEPREEVKRPPPRTAYLTREQINATLGRVAA